MVVLTWFAICATTMWILSYSLAVLLALGACDAAAVHAYNPSSRRGHLGSNNPIQSMQEVKQSLYDFYGLTDVTGPISKDTVKWDFETGSYRSQTGSSGNPLSEKPGSESHTTQGINVDSTGSGGVYGSLGNAVSMGMSGYDSSRSTTVQGSEVISSSVLAPSQQSSYSVSKPMQVVSSIPLQIGSVSVAKPSSQQLVQIISQSSSEQPASSGTVAQSNPLQLSQPSGQLISQTSFQPAVPSGRWPLKPLNGKHHQTGSRPVHNEPVSSSKPPKASQPSLSILQYGSVPSSLAGANYELVSQSVQSSGQTVNQPSIIQTPKVIDISVVQPSSQQIPQAVDASLAQVSSQQLLQGSQSVSQSNNVQPVDVGYVFVAQPGGPTPLKHHKGKHHFGSKPSSNSPLQTLRFTSVDQSSSQIPVQTSYQSGPQPALQLPVQANYQFSSPSTWQTLVQASYQSEAQPTSQQQGQTSYQSGPRFVVQQPAQKVYQSASQPTVPQPVEVIYQSEAQSTSQQPGQTSYQLVAEPGLQQPGMVSFSAAPLPLQPAQASYQLMSQLGVQQPAQVSSSVARPSHLQVGQSNYEYVVNQNGQTLFKPLDPIPVDLNIPSPLTSTFRPAHLPRHPRLQSVVLQSEQPVVLEVQPSDLSLANPGPGSYTFVAPPTGHLSRPLQQPSYQPPAKLWQDVFWPLVKPNELEYSSFEAQVVPNHVSFPVQFVSQPQMLPVSLSVTQSSSSPVVPVQSSYLPQVVSSYETVFQPVLQTSSVVAPSSSQTWSTPMVSNYESVLQSVQPELRIPTRVNYQTVTNQNAPGPAGSNRHSSRKLLKLLQQVKS
ncbi:mucin-4-like [Danio aesculapii]|uniref:mucin-4-like n=1 Tax=Danio aesculapii TaxID=1142201 RepID=UPI0024BF7050|nr:mucin-4-like [Danio aesculapii]